MAEKDYFYLNKVYPDADKVFSIQFRKPEDIIKDGIIILDTNVLLAPFDTNEKSIADIKKIYLSFKKKDKLFIPARVAREFANNRAVKISDVFLSVRQIKEKLNSGFFTINKYPLLEKNSHYIKLKKVFDSVKDEIKESRKYLEALEADIQSWTWDDIVSQSYKEIFTSEIIIELKKKEEDIIKDLQFRIDYKVAPGFKDSSKVDDGVGDLVIWQTILEIAKDKNSDIIFVTNDQKNDWFYKQDKIGLYPKYELFDEFRRYTVGKSFYIINFVKFLELSNAHKTTIIDIKETIINSNIEEYPNGGGYVNLVEGMEIEHITFGFGIVEKVEKKHGIADKIMVDFGNKGRKYLLVRFAKFKVLPTKANIKLQEEYNIDDFLSDENEK